MFADLLQFHTVNVEICTNREFSRETECLKTSIIIKFYIHVNYYWYFDTLLIISISDFLSNTPFPFHKKRQLKNCKKSAIYYHIVDHRVIECNNIANTYISYITILSIALIYILLLLQKNSNHRFYEDKFLQAIRQ